MIMKVCESIAVIVSAGVAVAELVLHYLDRKRRREAVNNDQELRILEEENTEGEDAIGRDISRYTIDGLGSYKKNRLVLEVIRRYAEQHRGITYAELLEVFPNTARGLKRKDSFWGCINLQKDAEKLYRETGLRRHFLADEDLVKLQDGTEVAVSTQWGKGNIDLFIEHARKLGFRIAIAKENDKH